MELKKMICALVCLLSVGSAQGAEHRVPRQYPTIQAAVNAAVTGDVVLVAPGTYNEQVTIDGKAITVRSTGTASTTKIDRANAAGDVFTIRNIATGAVTIQGITVLRTASDAVDVENSTLSLSNFRVLNSSRAVAVGVNATANVVDLQCVFLGGDGGGLRLNHATSRANLSACSFQQCGGGLGGAVFLQASAQAEITDTSFINCSAAQGGVVYVSAGAGLTLLRAYAQSVSATTGGFVFGAGDAAVHITDSTIKNCSVTDSGGFAYIESGEIAVENCVAENVTAAVKGSLFSVSTGHCTVDSLLYKNSTTTLRDPNIGGVVSIGAGSCVLSGLSTSNIRVVTSLSGGGCSCQAWRWYGLLIGLQGAGGGLTIRNSELGLTSEQGVCNCQCWSWESTGRLLYAVGREVLVEDSNIVGGTFQAVGCQGYGGHTGEIFTSGGVLRLSGVNFIGAPGSLNQCVVAKGAAQLTVENCRFEGTTNPIRTFDSTTLVVTGSRFSANLGGTIEHASTGSLAVASSVFVSNTQESSGSAIQCGGVAPVVDGCFFRANQQPSIAIGSYVLLANSVFCGPRLTEVSVFVIEKGPNLFEADCNDDCDADGLPNAYELNAGLATDCNANGIPDNCDADSGGSDCNANGIPDSCDIAGGAADCNANGIPDSCEADCDGDGVPNACEIASGAPDCDANGVPDVCQADCDDDGLIDVCEIATGSADCNANAIPDSCEIASGASTDFNKDSVIDACQPDMQFAGLELEIVPITNRGLDDLFPSTAVCYRLYAKTTQSASAVLGLFGNASFPMSITATGGFWQSPSGGDLASEVPCDLSGVLPSTRFDSWLTIGPPCASGNSAQNTGLDLSAFNKGGGINDNDGIVFVQPGSAQSVAGVAKRVLLAQLTTNQAVLPTGLIDVVGRASNGVGDWLAYGQSILPPALVDCNGNGQQDAFDIALGTALDCDQSGVPDSCEYGSATTDCNMNGISDLCDVTSAFSSDLNGNFVPDECECSGDVDGNGRVDVDDIIDVITSWGDTGNSLADVNNDNVVDATDLVIVLAGYGSCL